jgi:hypothetical protein
MIAHIIWNVAHDTQCHCYIEASPERARNMFVAGEVAHTCSAASGLDDSLYAKPEATSRHIQSARMLKSSCKC